MPAPECGCKNSLENKFIWYYLYCEWQQERAWCILKHTGYIDFKITGQNMVYLESKGLFIFYSKKDKSFGMQKKWCKLWMTFICQNLNFYNFNRKLPVYVYKNNLKHPFGVAHFGLNSAVRKACRHPHLPQNQILWQNLYLAVTSLEFENTDCQEGC